MSEGVRGSQSQAPVKEGKVSNYRKHGVAFRYPSHWTLSEDSGPQETTIHLESPGTSFWSITLFEELLDPEEIMETVVSAYEDDYTDLDIYMGATVADGLPTVSREIDFTCSNRLVSASLVAFQSRERTILIIFQGDDIDMASDRPQLEAISQSLTEEES